MASIPLSVHTVRETMPAGSGNDSTGRPRVASTMKSAQIGRAARAPVIPGPIGRFSS